MKYKMYCTDIEWLGDGDRGIKLWKEDLEGHSLWPRGEPSPLPLREMRGVDDIVKGISGFIKYWENMCNVDHTGEYRRRHEYLVHYWRDVKVALLEPFPVVSILRDGFWPNTRIQPIFEDQLREDGEEREEFGEDEAYVGPLQGCPQPSFRVGRNVHEGSFLAIRPADGETQPVWFARALSGVNSNAEHPNCILIQYLRPTSRDQDVRDFYSGWDSERGLRFKVDISQPPLWEETNAIMTAWTSTIRMDTRQYLLKVPSRQVEIIKESLASYV